MKKVNRFWFSFYYHMARLPDWFIIAVLALVFAAILIGLMETARADEPELPDVWLVKDGVIINTDTVAIDTAMIYKTLEGMDVSTECQENLALTILGFNAIVVEGNRLIRNQYRELKMCEGLVESFAASEDSLTATLNQLEEAKRLNHRLQVRNTQLKRMLEDNGIDVPRIDAPAPPPIPGGIN